MDPVGGPARSWALPFSGHTVGTIRIGESGGEYEAMDSTRIDERFYDESTYFDAASHLVDFDSPFQRYRVRMVRRLVGPVEGQRVLDLGCGWGTISFSLAPDAAEVVGLDFSHRAVEACEARLGRLPTPGLRFMVADARSTGLEPESFDLVVAADLFEHLYPEDSEAVVAEASRVLAPGGRFAIWTPSRSHVLEILKNRNILLKRDVSHVDYKSMGRLLDMLVDAGFAVEKAYYAESHLPGLRVLERLGQRWLPPLRRRIAVLGSRPEGVA